ncbi:MAG: hypothetical protein JJ992_03490, partial [Planctomycetes bacterium]|nr:hypothetical protein [Planctomycetota bacterium]
MPTPEKRDSTADLAESRAHAESSTGQVSAKLMQLSPDEIQQLVHQLEVRQIELEKQNEALRELGGDGKGCRLG